MKTEDLQAMFTGLFPGLLGVQLIAIEPDRVEAELTICDVRASCC